MKSLAEHITQSLFYRPGSHTTHLCDETGRTVADFHHPLLMQQEECFANVELGCEAHNVTLESGQSPKELWEELKALRLWKESVQSVIDEAAETCSLLAPGDDAVTSLGALIGYQQSLVKAAQALSDCTGKTDWALDQLSIPERAALLKVRELLAVVDELRKQNESVWVNRDTFCQHINIIGHEVLGFTGNCSPEAVSREVVVKIGGIRAELHYAKQVIKNLLDAYAPARDVAHPEHLQSSVYRACAFLGELPGVSQYSVAEAPVPPKPKNWEEVAEMARERLEDILKDDDGQAHKEARKFLKIYFPDKAPLCRT